MKVPVFVYEPVPPVALTVTVVVPPWQEIEFPDAVATRADAGWLMPIEVVELQWFASLTV